MKAQLAPALSARLRPIYRRDTIEARFFGGGKDFMKKRKDAIRAYFTREAAPRSPEYDTVVVAATAAAPGAQAPPPPMGLSADCKRMYVHWSYIMCLATSIVNAATLIQFDEVVMHMTGPSTKGPLFLASGLAARGWHNLGTVGAFLGGCFFAGLATSQNDANTPVKETGLFKPFVAPTCSLY